jgi:hypothetical protein
LRSNDAPHGAVGGRADVGLVPGHDDDLQAPVGQAPTKAEGDNGPVLGVEDGESKCINFFGLGKTS